MEKELKAVRINPEVFHLAKIQAVMEDKSLGDWLEEAIKEKLERSKKDGNEKRQE
jgi:predicted HicB family RNase H-like nuclease